MLLSAALIVSAVPAFAVTPHTNSAVYIQNFDDDEDILQKIKSQSDGWSYGSDNADSSINIDVNSSQNTSNGLCFSSTDWYKSMWLGLNLKENAVAERMALGADSSEAEAEVDQYLSEDLTVSFRARLDIDGISGNPSDVHESYIRVKNSETAAITELHTKGDVLYLKGLDSEEYHEIKKIKISKENTDYHTFEISYNMENNTYRLKVDNGEVEINGTKDIKAGAGDGEAVIGQVGSIELGHHWSGWWQRMTFDDLVITTPAVDEPTQAPTAKPTQEPTEKPTQAPTAKPTQEPTEKPTQAPTAKPTQKPDDNSEVYYLEDFNSESLETEMKTQKNGWSFGCASGHEDLEDISVDEHTGADDKCLRFAATDWFKNMWMVLDLNENGIYKQMQAGKSEQEAENAVNEYLSGSMKISFKTKFEQNGKSNGDTHEQYIRIKSEDGHVVTDFHLYNNSLELIALNQERTANERYKIKDVNWNKGANEWQDIAVYFDKIRNSYMVEINGEAFLGTPHGRWIPAGSASGVDVSEPMDIGTISSIEIGHFWSAWWGELYLEDLKISEYIPYPAELEITGVIIKNQHNSTSMSPGNKYIAEPYITGGEVESIKEEWSKLTESGWETMTEETIPSGVKKIKVKITAVSKKGETAVIEKEVDVNEAGTVDYQNVMVENFEAAGKKNEINNQINGWTITGTSTQTDVSSGFGGSANALRFASTDSNLNSNLNLDFTKRGAEYKEGDKVRLKLSYAFGLGSDSDAVNATSIAYVRVKDTSGTAFTAVEIHGDKMYVIAYDENEKKNKGILVAQGKENVINVWRNLELYLDTEINKYCILINEEPVGMGYQKWFTPSNSAVEGSAVPMSVSGIGSIDIGQENSAWWANTRIDNIAVDKYYLPIDNTFRVNDIRLENTFNSKLAVAGGSPVMVAAVVDKNSGVREDRIITDSAMNVTYEDEAGNTMPFEDNIIPYNAVKINVSGTFKNVVGQEATCQKTFEIAKNTPPSISDLAVEGEFVQGGVMSAKYLFADTESPDNDNTVVSWYRSETMNGEYVFAASNLKEYTLKAADISGYMKVVAVPYDSYGAVGEAKEQVFTSKIITDFDMAYSRLNIDTKPSGKSIDLPEKDEETGITYEWKSSNSSVLSDDGKITRPKKLTTVTLTVTATNMLGEVQTRRFTIEITSGNSSANKPSYGGGGGGGGGGSTAGYVATPTAAPVKDTVSVEETENKPVNKPLKNGKFPDVSADVWYFEYIEKLAEEGIVSGDETGSFNPENPITRAEFLKMIAEIFNIIDKDANCDFTDVAPETWYYTYVASAVKFDIVQGNGDGRFNPSQHITRQDMAVIAVRAAQLSGILPENGELNFADSNDISDYAKESVASMASAGVIAGADGNFNPKDFATRGQAAKIICVLNDMLND